MTETQKAVLEKLSDGDMNVTELCEELHISPNILRKRLLQMESNGWIKREGSYYQVCIDYSPKLDWSFKELLKVWK